MSYLDDARARAKRRKSPWNLLLVPASLVPAAALWAAGALCAEFLHGRFYEDETLRTGEGPWIVVAAIAPMFAAIPIGLLVGNFVVRQVGPARAALDREVAVDPALGYRASQAALARIAVGATLAAAAATTLGALLPW